MEPKRYATATAFRRALEDRLQDISRKEGVDLQRLRRQVAFDRLLARLFQAGQAPALPASLKVLTEETIKSSAIEGVVLDPENVRSSLARRLGLEVGGLTAHKDRNIDGVVEMMSDATQQFSKPLTKERLFDWHAHLSPGVRTTRDKFRVGAWRDDSQGPMQVVSGPVGRHKVHYEAPTADHVEGEMGEFLAWFDGNEQEDPLLKAGIAHLWFVTIHPFEDGNGRIGRAVAEMCLARSDGSAQRFYSMSSQILEERKEYYEVLEKTQAGSLDITKWLTWFLGCLDRAVEQSNQITSSALEKELFWKDLKQRKVSLNDRADKSPQQTIQWVRGKTDERQMDENDKGFLAHCPSRHRRADCHWGHRTRRGRRTKHILQANEDCRVN